MNRPLISIVIPTRPHESCGLTMETLMAQTLQDFEVHVIVDHEGRGQSWARNRGAEVARGHTLLFSDNDLLWEPQALERLHVGLLDTMAAVRPGERFTAYAYGAYQFFTRLGCSMERGAILCNRPWDWQALKACNFISTMALIDREVWCREHLAFDEGLRRLEDWDLFLTMGERGYCGAFIPGILFHTEFKPGVSHQNPLTHEAAEAIVRTKHGI